MYVTDTHPLRSRLRIAHQNRTARRSIPCPSPHEPDAVRGVEVVVLVTVGIEIAGESDVREFVAAGGIFGGNVTVFAFGAATEEAI
jgi:hypothetical protein